MSDTLSLKIIFNAVNNTNGVFSGLNSKVKQSDNNLQSLNSQFSSLRSLVGAGIVAGATRQFFNLGAGLEQTKVGFEVMLSSATKAQRMVDAINKTANATPYDNTDLYQVVETMLGFEVAHQKVLPYMSMLGDVARGDSERLKSLGLAFAQVQSAGKLTGQDLLQMINAGFNPLKDIAAITGKQIKVLKDEMSKGAISADMVAQAFERATSKGGSFYQMSQRMSETGSGVASTAVGKLKLAIAELSNSAMPAMTAAIKDVTVAIDMLGVFAANNGDLMQILVSNAIKGLGILALFKGYKFGKSLLMGLTSTIGGVQKLIRVTRVMNIALSGGNLKQAARLIRIYGDSAKNAAKLVWLKNRAVSAGTLISKLFRISTYKAIAATIRQAVVTKASAAWQWAKNSAMTVGAAVANIYSVATNVVTGLLTRQGVVTAIMTVKQWALNAAMYANPAGLIIAAIGALISGVVYCYTEFAEFRAVLLTTWDAIKGFGEAIYDFVVAPFEFVWELIKGVGNAISSLWNGGSLEDAGGELSKGFNSGIGKSDKRLDNAWNTTKNTFNSIGSNYDKHLADEQAKQAEKEAQESIEMPDLSKLTQQSTTVNNNYIPSEQTEIEIPDLSKYTNKSKPKYNEDIDISELQNYNTNIAKNSISEQQIKEIQVNYSPTIQLTGDVSEKSKNDILKMFKEHKNELVKLVKEELKRDQRLAYAK
ncbi:MAG: tape measure protein [Bacteroidales bacterium]|nr:tape measure protein [Bacteroidales bacterium]